MTSPGEVLSSFLMASLGAVEQAMLRQFDRVLRPLLAERLKAVRAFGSRARGDARPSSDLDVLVLLDQVDRRTRRSIYDMAEDVNEAFNWTVLLSPLVMGEAEFDSMKRRGRRLVLDILREGVSP